MAYHLHSQYTSSSNPATALGLPPECASLRPLTRLWLASRLDHSRDAVAQRAAQAATRQAVYQLRVSREQAAGDKDKDDETRADEEKRVVGLVPLSDGAACDRALVDGDSGDSQADAILEAQHELEITQTPYNRPGMPRAFSLANLRIQVQLLRILGPWAAQVAWQNARLIGHTAVYMVGTLVDGVIPAAELWCSSKLLDLVEASLAGRSVPYQLAVGYAAAASVLSIGNRLINKLMSKSVEVLRDTVNSATERTYIAAKLDLAQQPYADPIQASLVYETGVVIGINSMVDEDGEYIDMGMYGGWGLITSVSSLLRKTIDVASKFVLLLNILGHDGGSAGGSMINRSNALLAILSLAPSCCQFFSDALIDWADRESMTVKQVKLNMERNAVESIVTQTSMRNELVLFGLRDWIMERWDLIDQLRSRKFRRNTEDIYDLVDGVMTCVNVIVRNLFYVLLATRIIRTHLSLGDIHLHQRLGEALFDSVFDLRWRIVNAYQAPFFLAALVSASEGPQSIRHGIDYEAHRIAGGMRIEARSLTYAYKLGGKPVLKGIDLVVEPGQTLAVVGFNGSGKTTLVKTLLGLNRHGGTLHINGREITVYDPQTLHARMSCLFQDYARYEMTLRDNIGLGDTRRMHDADVLAQAIERGGATELVERYGLDAWLSPGKYKARFVGGRFVDEEEEGDQPPVPRAEAVVEGEAAEAVVDGEAAGGIDEDTPPETVSVDDSLGRADDDEMGAAFLAETAPELAADTASDAGSAASNASVLKMVGDLSGGQWQRIALARAFMRADSADLIVFDEPSASLDPLAEAELFGRIHSLAHAGGSKGVTTIFISHRFNTVRGADRIAFMDDGRIIEYGTHDELMALGGRYHECFNLQRRGFE